MHSRRNFLSGAAAALALGATTGFASQPGQSPAAPTAPSNRRRVLRFAHLTDTHVMPEREGFQSSEAGFRAALRDLQALKDPCELVLFGGDMIMDGLKRSKDEVRVQFDIFTRVVKEELRLPHRLCLGNHDVWGWAGHKPEEAEDPQYGKRLAMDILGMKERYYSFDQAGWHFVVLDSVQIDHGSRHGYTARADDLQFAWLEKDLAAVPAERPVLVLSHVPILSSCVFFDDDLEKTGTWVIPGAWMHIDARRFKDLFRKHPNVKLCLSGHVHLWDDLNYLGVRYLCNGALCGGWWKGPYQEFGPAYATVDLFDDGSAEVKPVYYHV